MILGRRWHSFFIRSTDIYQVSAVAWYHAPGPGYRAVKSKMIPALDGVYVLMVGKPLKGKVHN
jgi:hypothetical protein